MAATDFKAGALILVSVTPTATQDRTQTFRLTPGLFTVQLSKGDDSFSTGFCVVTVDGIAYHTQQLGTDVTAENGVRKQVVFQLNVLQKAEVSVESSWGTSANYTATSSQHIANGQSLQVITMCSNHPL